MVSREGERAEAIGLHHWVRNARNKKLHGEVSGPELTSPLPGFTGYATECRGGRAWHDLLRTGEAWLTTPTAPRPRYVPASQAHDRKGGGLGEEMM